MDNPEVNAVLNIIRRDILMKRARATRPYGLPLEQVLENLEYIRDYLDDYIGGIQEDIRRRDEGL